MEQKNTVISRGYVQLCKHRTTNTVQVSDQTRWGCMIRRHACHGESTLERVNHRLTPDTASMLQRWSRVSLARDYPEQTARVKNYSHDTCTCTCTQAWAMLADSDLITNYNSKLKLPQGSEQRDNRAWRFVCSSGSQHDMIRQVPDWGAPCLWYKQRGTVTVHVMFASKLQCRPVGRKGPHRHYIAEASDAQMACKCSWHTSVVKPEYLG